MKFPLSCINIHVQLFVNMKAFPVNAEQLRNYVVYCKSLENCVAKQGVSEPPQY